MEVELMNSYEVIAFRDDRWWTFEIPAQTSPSPRGGDHRIVAMGQARKAAEIEDEARSLAALWTETDETDIEVQVVYRLPVGLQADIEHARELDTAGRAALEEAATLRRRAVHELRTSAGLSQADAAAVLGLSRQRVHQLERA